ncbi:MAG TPA: hypothetical protein VNZ26_10270 [Vicinamibacterales bacterium]|jgi:hypothetical protein|nr:hypothetical protein [Vicinamibacterales bacterium]
MSARLISGLVLAVSLGVLLPACNSQDNSTLQPTPANIVTDPIPSTTIQPLGTAVFQFNESIPGSVTVTITSVAPQSGYILQIGLGSPNGNACAVLFSQAASVGQGVTASTASPGTFCVTVSDIQGIVTNPITFTGTIQHT